MEGARRHPKVVERGRAHSSSCVCALVDHGGVLVAVFRSWWWWALVMERGVLVVMRVGTCGRWWRRHVKGVERGTLVIVRVGTHQRWRGAGRRLSIVVVVGTHGWHWVVVAVNGAGGRLSSFVGGGGACAWRRGRRSWVFVVVRVVVGHLWVEAWALSLLVIVCWRGCCCRCGRGRGWSRRWWGGGLGW